MKMRRAFHIGIHPNSISIYHTSVDQTGYHHVVNDVERFRRHRMFLGMMLYFVREHGLKARKCLFDAEIRASATKGPHKLLSKHLRHGKKGALVHLIAVDTEEEGIA